MWKSLILKELRENALIAAAGLVAYLAIAGMAMHLPVIPWIATSRPSQIPFLEQTFAWRFAVAAVLLAGALGFHQSLGDSWGSVYLFLLHRPLSRRQLFQTKLLVGMTLYAALSAIPILLIAMWAASPGTHASPFEWSMTLPVWRVWLACSLVYIGAFLTGIRPANWFGSRFAPLATAGVLAVFSAAVPMAAVGILLWLGSYALLLWLSLVQAACRDFG